MVCENCSCTSSATPLPSHGDLDSKAALARPFTTTNKNKGNDNTFTTGSMALTRYTGSSFMLTYNEHFDGGYDEKDARWKALHIIPSVRSPPPIADSPVNTTEEISVNDGSLDEGAINSSLISLAVEGVGGDKPESDLGSPAGKEENKDEFDSTLLSPNPKEAYEDEDFMDSSMVTLAATVDQDDDELESALLTMDKDDGENEDRDETGEYDEESTYDLTRSEDEEDAEVDEEDEEDDDNETVILDDSFQPDPQETVAQMEPWTIFSARVALLLDRLGQGTITPDLVDMARSKTHLITTVSYSPTAENSPMVIRIPRKTKLWLDDKCLYQNTFNHVAVLEYIRRLPQGKILLLPRWYAYDGTANNEIGKPYILEEMLPTIYDTVHHQVRNIDARLAMCDQVVTILVAREQTRFPAAGKLVSAWQLPHRHINADNLNSAVKLAGLGAGVNIKPQKSIADIIKAFIVAWPIREKMWFLRNYNSKWKQLRVVAEEMYRFGFFDEEGGDENRFVLYNGDLHPRNIAVEFGNHGTHEKKHRSPRITGLLDWDDTLAIPPVLARRPPVWLWISPLKKVEEHINSYGHADYDMMQQEPVLTIEDKRVKETFFLKMEKALPGYIRDCYNPGNKWVRRMFLVVRDGFFLEKNVRRCEAFLQDWAKWKEEFRPLGIPSGWDFWKDEDEDSFMLEALEEMQLF